MSVRIITDSTFDVTDEVLARLTIVPLTVIFGDKQFTDRVDIDHLTFYKKLIESDILPVTSQATPAAFDDAFRKATDDGCDVVCITLSSTLSGTYQSAVIAAEEYQGKVFVVDSKTVAIGAGILAEMAIKLADGGKSAQEIADILTLERENIRIVALLDTLEYLHKGGRISKAVAITGSLLSIKPVVNLVQGQINLLGKARGSKQGNNLLVKEIQSSGGVDFDRPVLLGYTGLHDGLLQKYIEDSSFLWESYTDTLPITPIGSVIGTHIGPGAIAAAFFVKNHSV